MRVAVERSTTTTRDWPYCHSMGWPCYWTNPIIGGDNQSSNACGLRLSIQLAKRKGVAAQAFAKSTNWECFHNEEDFFEKQLGRPASDAIWEKNKILSPGAE
eukprot:EG_transcript_25552